MKNTKKGNVIVHGECYAFKSVLPKTAKKKKIDGHLIIADSETSGNHHVVDISPNVDVYEDGDIKFIVNSEPTNIRCLYESRHDTIELSPGIWEFGIQKEYDYFTESLRNVRD